MRPALALTFLVFFTRVPVLAQEDRSNDITHYEIRLETMIGKKIMGFCTRSIRTHWNCYK
jgi:hypothetical protein